MLQPKHRLYLSLIHILTKFRQNILKDTPPEAKKHAEDFVREHPNSVCSIYLIRKYFITSTPVSYTHLW